MSPVRAGHADQAAAVADEAGLPLTTFVCVQRCQGPLPGLDAQLTMAPSPRLGWDPLKFPAGATNGAALLLVYPLTDDTLHLALTVRGSGLRNHTGQVSLPGGRVDDGETIEAAALREANEEIGIDPAAVELLGRLTPLHIPVSGFLLHPVVGFTSMRPGLSARRVGSRAHHRGAGRSCCRIRRSSSAKSGHASSKGQPSDVTCHISTSTAKKSGGRRPWCWRNSALFSPREGPRHRPCRRVWP